MGRTQGEPLPHPMELTLEASISSTSVARGRRYRGPAPVILLRCLRLRDLLHTWATLASITVVEVKTVSERLSHPSPLVPWHNLRANHQGRAYRCSRDGGGALLQNDLGMTAVRTQVARQDGSPSPRPSTGVRYLVTLSRHDGRVLFLRPQHDPAWARAQASASGWSAQ